MVSLRTILSKKMPTGSQPEEPFDAMAFAHQQTEWYNNAEGHLDQEDGYDCPICRNKGYLRVVTEEGGIPNAWMRPCQCQKVRQSIRQMRRSGLQHIIQDYTFAKFQATEPWQQKLKAAAQAYAQSLEGWFFFGGQSGSGKTHLCTAICRKALHQGRQVRYMLWRDDVSRIKAVANQGEEYNAAIAPYKHAELLYIDDLVDEMIAALEGREHHCEFEGVDTVLTASGRYCAAPVTHRATLGQIVQLLDRFKAQPETLLMPEIPAGSFAKKLYSTYLSYLPREKAAFPLKMNVDARGSFTELLKTANCGQFSVNISRPGVTKGQHWHNTKWEFFIVVSGHGLIQQREVGAGEVLNFEVSGEKIEAVHMLPGYTHNIINLSETDDLVTLMWANECFDPKKPDTFFEVV